MRRVDHLYVVNADESLDKADVRPTRVKTESTRKLSNCNFQWTRTLYQNNLKNIAIFFTFFNFNVIGTLMIATTFVQYPADLFIF